MLDKKTLRQFADHNPAPGIPANHGLLHASQADYIIRTAVKIIDHRRTLVLYVYNRKRAAAGDPTPVWTMFQAGSDYITLARREDGSTHWREAVFERLGTRYSFKSDCAFYSAQDEQRVRSYFHDTGHGGIAALVSAQKAILDRRTQERRRKREANIIRRMAPIRALPRNWQIWARRDIMPAYFFYDYKKGAKTVTGTCSACGETVTLTGMKHNAKGVCPRCKRELTMKSKGRMGRIWDRDTVQFIQRTGSGELVIRIVKICHTHDRDTAKREFRENARIFIRRTEDGGVHGEYYYYSYGDAAPTHWKPGVRPVFSHYQYNFEADLCGHVYSRNLPAALAGTPWEYCPLAAFYEHFRGPMELVPFLAAYLKHPRLEHLIKTGFFNLASDLAYRGDYNRTLDETQNRTHRILQVAAEDIPFLRELDADMGTLRVFQSYAKLKDRRRLLCWQRENNISRDVGCLLERMTPHKLMRYIGEQYAALRRDGGNGCYGNMQHAVSEYRDYLDMCGKLGYDMSNSFVLYPKDLREAHDRVQGRVKAKADAQLRKDFKAAMETISGRLDYEADGMKMILPATPDEIIAEGQALHHCVGGYVNRVAKHECVILFLRQCEDLAKPFYTVEVRGKKVIQIQGKYHCDPTPEVEKFMAQWERKVLRAA